MLGTRWDMGYMRTRHYMGILYGIKWDTLVMTSSLLWKTTQGPFYRGKKTIWTSGFRDSPISERPMSYILIPKAGRMTMMIPLDVHKSYTFWAGFNRQPEDIWWRFSSITSTMLCICAVFIVSVLLGGQHITGFLFIRIHCTRLFELTHWHLEVIALNRLLLAGCNHIYIYIYIVFELFYKCRVYRESNN